MALSNLNVQKFAKFYFIMPILEASMQNISPSRRQLSVWKSGKMFYALKLDKS